MGVDGLIDVTERAEITVEAVEDTHGKVQAKVAVQEGITMGVLEDPTYPVLIRFTQKAKVGLVVDSVERHLKETLRRRRKNLN